MIRTVKNIIKNGLAIGHKATAVLDQPYLSKEKKCKWPPVFIIGAPRSGTSLLYQLLVNSFEFSYFPNIANRFYMCPITATKIGKQLCRKYRSSFSSSYGFEKGCMAPSEAGNIWNRWFPHENREGYNYTPADYLSPPAQHTIYQMVVNIQEIYGAPFITKNVKMSVRLPALQQMFPEAVYICIQRDIKDSALSNLAIRRKNKTDWWSVMPKEINQIKHLSDTEQVYYQVYYVNKNIEEDLRLIPSTQIHKIKYESICTNPGDGLSKLHKFLTNNQLTVERTHPDIPTEFPVSRPGANQWVQKEDLQKIEKLVNELKS